MRKWVLLLVLTALAGAAVASDVDPRVELAKKLPGAVKADDISATPVTGIYEVRRGTDVAYVTADGRYYFSGELHDLKNQTNLTEQRLSEVRRKLLAGVSENDMLIFGPEKAPYTITVFTDVDCGYCRKLHGDVGELNRLGVRVRYLFYPRSGPGSESWKVAESIWCSANRKDALTRAKRGEEIPSKECANPVAKEYDLGQALGIRGTPGIYTAKGDYLAGYMPPERLLAQLKALEKQ